MANELRTRACIRCGTEKSITEDCKPCKAARAKKQYEANKERHAAKGKAYYESNREKAIARQKARTNGEKREEILAYQRNYRLKQQYGITTADFKAMNAAQGGVCYICKNPEVVQPNLSVDHDHTSGKIRKLLCTPCNTSLGLAGDDPERLRLMAQYVEEHRE